MDRHTGRTGEARGQIWRRVRAVAVVFREAAVRWYQDDAFQLAAALAFYTVFSLAPLVVIAISVASLAFGREAAVDALVGQMEALVGRAGGIAVRDVVENAAYSQQGTVATLLGVGAIVIGATAVFAQLQVALNRIWGVHAEPRWSQVGALIRGRLVGFALALGAGFVLIVSLVLSAVLSATQSEVTRAMPEWPWLWRGLEIGISFLIVTGLFMTVYKTLPDVEIGWRDVTVGAAVSALLFAVGKYAIGLSLGRMSIGDVYGTAGSFAVLLVWVYYTALVSFFGAEFTLAYAKHHGWRIQPSPYAVRCGDDAAPSSPKAGRREVRLCDRPPSSSC
jgi:membrane protein